MRVTAGCIANGCCARFPFLRGIATTRPVVGVLFATERITHLRPAQFFAIAFWIGFTTIYIVGEAYIRSHPMIAE